ncbi:hypothetical protein DFQ28_001964 [Apophysomyces sp. BC1034]|nr:hypothetical protein DFQ28_001964 [Apophysomyces sp. BC1034]
MYAIAIARAHAFNDGIKRTALNCTLAFLRHNGYSIPATSEQTEIDLAEIMVGVAEGAINHQEMSGYLIALYLFTRPFRIQNLDEKWASEGSETVKLRLKVLL